MPRLFLPRRFALLSATLAVIVTGTTLRLVPISLPAGFVKYGGSVLWGAMVYGLVALLFAGVRVARVVAVSLTIAVAVELFRLVHTPWLDAFRLTLAGQLLLGRIFSLWNIVAYAAGITLAVAVDRALQPSNGRLFGPRLIGRRSS